MNIPIIILAAVFIMTAVRKIGRFQLKVWQIMSIGALAVLVTGSISPARALAAIDLQVIIFLFGMFVVGQALEDSGYLAKISYNLFSRAKNLDALLITVIFGCGLSSALLMNDTLAIVATPVMLLLASQHRIEPKMLLLALAFSITIGSVMSPIGNPQNLLIASSILNPFVEFFTRLILPTLISLAALYVILRIYYREQFKPRVIKHEPYKITNPELAILSKMSVAFILLMIALKIALQFVGAQVPLVAIAIVGATPILIYRIINRKFHIIRKIDYHTLIFFASMFILMASVWNTGFFQYAIETLKLELESIPAILLISTLLSQFISNVPLVALYKPMLEHSGVSVQGLIALAAGSTIAGNLTILGAASNIIIFAKAERHENIHITFWDFFRIGLPLTIINLAVYWIFVG